MFKISFAILCFVCLDCLCWGGQGRSRFLHRCGSAICVRLVTRLATVSLTSQGRTSQTFFLPLPSFSPSPSIVSLLLSALSSSFRSPETEGRAAAVSQRKEKDLRKGKKNKNRRKEKAGWEIDRDPISASASSGAQQFLFHTCLCGHSSVSVDLNVRHTGV